MPPMTAEQSYALGTSQGRDRINQQLRANPQYLAYLQSIGVNTSGPMHLSDQQRKMAADWVRQQMGSIGGLEIDPSGNLNNPQGFGTQLKQWGPVAAAAGGIAAPYILPALGIGGGGGATGAAGTLASGSVPTSLAMQAVPASIASQSASAAIPFAAGGAAVPLAATSIPGLESAVPATVTSQNASQGVPLGGMTPNPSPANGGGNGSDAGVSGMPDWLKKLASPEGAAGLAALIAGLANNNGSGQQSSEELKRINAITEARMRRVDPLHQVATALAFGRLPVNYRQGVQLNNVPLPG